LNPRAIVETVEDRQKKLQEKVKQQRIQIRKYDDRLKAKLDKVYDVSDFGCHWFSVRAA
jgi:hypothetical protein